MDHQEQPELAVDYWITLKEANWYGKPVKDGEAGVAELLGPGYEDRKEAQHYKELLDEKED